MHLEDLAVGAVRAVVAPAAEITRTDNGKIRASGKTRQADPIAFPGARWHQEAQALAQNRAGLCGFPLGVIFPEVVEPAVEAAHQCRSDGEVPSPAIHLCR